MVMNAAVGALHNRIDLLNIPFSERGSRILLFRRDDALYMRLAERWAKQETIVGHYRQRAPIIDKFTFLSENGEPLALNAETYPHVAEMQTLSGTFKIAYQDVETLMIRLPAGTYGFSFEVLCDRGQTDRRGGILRGVRSVAYTTNAQVIENDFTQNEEGRFHVRLKVQASDGNVLLLNITPRLGFNRSMPDADSVIADARARWDSWFASPPHVLAEYRDQYWYAWWVLRAGLINSRFYFTREALLPSKIHYVGVWHWDQFFHAIAYRYVDTRLAEDQIRILIDHQQPNGMIPDAIHDEGLVTHLLQPVDADVTKPPLISWTVLKLYEKSGHTDFLEETFEPLKRWNDWWFNENVDAHGLAVYRHPFSSGLDDSPLWDYGMPVTSPDLNTYLWLQMRTLARIGEIIGEHRESAEFSQRADHLANLMVKHMWDDELGLFNALHNGERIPVKTPFSLLPVWIDTLPSHITAKLLAHLVNPQEFWTRFPLPTVAIDDPHYDPNQMWRGPTWLNINYLFVEALTHIGRYDLARDLRRKSLDLLMQHKDIYEYYHPDTGERPMKAATIFGWSSAVFVELAIQESLARGY